MRKIVFNHVYPFFILNHLLTDDNSGFRPNDSATNRLLSILENIHKGFDDHMDSIFVSLDISKAFDRVWHEGLIYKLQQNGISGSLLSWFSSYLTNRRQKVVLSGCSSSYKHLHSGVPQGSILGPMLFLLYINDMTLGLQSQVHQFADDTNLLFTYKNPTLAVQVIINDLQILSRWADQWRVTFNPLKTKFMVFSLKHK